MNLVVGRNSFISNIFYKWPDTVIISHNEIENIDLLKFNSLYVLSFPNKYYYENENIFDFEKKIFSKFEEKKITYFSTSKVYKNKLKCNELDLVSPQSYYADNKLSIEELIPNYSKNHHIFRISNVFTKNNYSRNTFFSQLMDNLTRSNIIDFDINEKSIKDFISLNSLGEIIYKMRHINDIGLFNVGSEIGLTIEEVLNYFLSKKKFENAKKRFSNKIVSQTLDISKLSKLININSKDIHQKTIEELKK